MIFKIFLLVIFCVAGCSSSKVKKDIRTPSSVELPQCLTDCSKDQVCMNTFTEKGAACAVIPEGPEISFALPFDSNTEVVCTHSKGTGSHSGANAFYALDLATDYNKPASIVRASADGVAFVFMGEDGNLCPEPAGTSAKSEVSTCGQSWGNHIRILHSQGYMSFYVHLERPLIKNGAFVHKGDPIGIEGRTGAAGHRHLHWSIQKLSGTTTADWIKHISWAGESVPFQFEANPNGENHIFSSAEVSCAHVGIGEVDATLQPHFKGIK
ncbi:MAG: M23 family metallopeptidase [Bacteriovorax sp.]|nr:M23 family metallopeptidase [Bacteriovorax sp.]